MFVRRWSVLAAAVVAIGGLGACGGDDDGGAISDPDATTTTSTAAAGVTTTTAAPAPPVDSSPPIAASVEQWFTDWTEVNGTAASENDGVAAPIDPAVFAYGAGPDGTEAFAGQISAAVAMGGLRDPASGAMTTVFQGADPDGETTASAMITLISMLGDLDDLEPLATAYRDIALNPAGGEQRYIVSGEHEFVIRGVPGAAADDGLVFVFAHATTDEATAVARADAVQAAVLALLG